MKKQNKWTIAIVSALIGIGACTTSVQAADTTSDVSTNQSTSATTTSYSKADYFSRNPKIIRVKHSTPAYSDAALTNSVRTARSGEHFLVQSLITPNCKAPVVRTTTGLYLPAKTSLLAAVKGYQNPKGYHQVHYTQIKPYGTVGYNLYRGYEGIKTWRVMHRLGTWAGHNLYNPATYNAVKNFQRRHNLPATGDVDLKTWQKLGFSNASWYDIDNYIAPLRAQAWQGLFAHIEAMIHQAYQYMGKPWLAGCSSSPAYGVDCSGLVMQSLYAGGISPTPTSSIGHAHPGNEWNSRNLWADKHLKRVPYSERQRGDLVFYYQPGTHTIWHVAIYLGNNRMIESWPPRVMVQPIINGQRNVIAGIKRPFI
ncbi:NlpC/P60 family protein [Lactobacillus amylovorus]|uniref:C40 family peptidase n=1 Tax=Lactobacillus amylovorus TaxID=1604 RepID=UPI00232EA99D|nr:NlpC/P60 family protein [Lactobacillus amylovorus]MDB6226759.1 NlpC/P60 family protein [Lactobacillus amylovorus]